MESDAMQSEAATSTRVIRGRDWAGVFAAGWLIVCSAVATAAPAPTPQQLQWLQRATYGASAENVAQLQRLGQARYSAALLQASDDAALPAPVRAQLQQFDALHTPLDTLLVQYEADKARLQAMPDGDDKVAASKQWRARGGQMLTQARQAQLLRAVYAPDQMREQLVWFWLNHFSVYADKGRVKWMAADYMETAVRPNATGKFADLVMATLQSPAMLEYLDNAKNAKGKVNENYARELMELHTLGVDGGYTQQDVQQLALILTGAGLVQVKREGLVLPPAKDQAQVVRKGLFEFNPARHQPGDKTLLGQRIAGGGLDEIERAVQLLVRQPACAQFISHKLAEYFVSDKPPAALVKRMAATFQRSDGDIAQVMQTMLAAPEFATAQPRKFKDPNRLVVSAMRLAYDGEVITNGAPMVSWVQQLGEPLFGRITPDGWSLQSQAWTSSGQLARRFEVARTLGSAPVQLFQRDDVPQELSNARKPPITRIDARPAYRWLQPSLSVQTRQALEQARTPQEWNGFLLSSPDFNYR
ncbi:DUF1800 domain-containing protein [Xanthomonas campestris]|uniref:DUF1800 domain-containing protein n=1 Tax=Xanthomonas campestris TaxID=339 RepID=UPI001E6059AF|nr:DUF1800 domain-containing protein [Xanthomonas campestris]MCC5063363.1 DUF1800 domain-containing protein [Xanthomonas campestris pv. raphani]MEA9888978.1 DUF1800 domain-containing protein [Xanthomonas campestris pv. raphani]MEA9973442.1 DUF1800 domain-containing protein [Xanthomonas campestris pv. raphani]